MKKTSGLWVLALVLAVMLAACGGGGGGGDDVVSPPPATTIPDGTFVKTIAPASTTAWSAPFNAISYNHEQHLVLASDINGAGYIQSLSLRLDASVTSAVACPNLTVKMGHTLLTGLTTTFASNVEQGKGSLVTVRNPAAFTVPAGNAGDYFTINLDTPFYYNGVDNLVAEFIQDGGCNGGVILSSGSVTNSALFTITNGSATGILVSNYLNMKFHFKGGTNTVIAQDQTSDSAIFNITPGRAGRTQMLILASDIAGKGLITGMAIQPNTTTVGGTLSGVSVVLSHTTSTNLAADFATNSANSASAKTVVSNLTYTIPNSMPTPVWIPFNAGSFNYDGTSNILADIIVSSATMVFSIDSKDVPDHRIVTSNDPSAATGIPRLYSLQPVFRFKGGTVDTIIGLGSGYSQYMFNVSATGAKEQFLYFASELGAGGKITKMACRLVTPDLSVATDYPNFEVIMSSTTGTVLGTDFAANLPSPVTVFSGTYSLPGGLKKGDWIEIPLTTPFTYDAARNLVVQTASDQGANVHNCSVLGNALYTNRRLYTNDRASPNGSAGAALRDQRLWISN